MNKVVLMGRLTKDPDIRYTQENIAMARYTIAVDRRRKQEEQTADFINIVAWGKGAEFAEKYLFKGMKICLEGRIQTGSFTNKNGQKVYTVDVVAEQQEFCEGRKPQEGAQQSVQGNLYAQANTGASRGSQASSGQFDGFVSIPDEIQEELPFK